CIERTAIQTSTPQYGPVRVSVIMPAYNRGYIISEALESLFAQTYHDFELIVVDDGSTDDTGEVVSRFTDTRLRYVRHEQNRGCSAAYNTGFRQSRGEFVAILDSDDLWRAGKLANDVDFLDRHREADAVFTDLEKLDGSRFTPSFMRESPCMAALLAQKRWPKERVFSQREMYLCLLQEVPVKTPACTIRRAALEDVGYFNETWPSGSDWNFFLRFSKHHRFGYVDEPLAIVRVQSDATHRLHAVADKSLVLGMLHAEFKHTNDPEIRKSAKMGYRDAVRHLSWEYLRRGEKLNASQALARGFLATGQPGLLARSLYALVRKDS
ncbi:MAG: glycosyltransferase family 2 protein, partial [Candidatus Acidiferrum sp.]